MRSLIPILTIISFSLCRVFGVPPVLNYAGQVAVDGKAFEGNGLFKFALVSANGTSSYWSNDGTSVAGTEPQSSISVTVNGGLYSVLLGNTAIQGMGAIDPQVFAQHSDAKLRVWFSDGVNGFQQLSPDRPFASVPYAFSAGNAETAGSAPIANGAVTKSMLSSEVINDLNRKITMNDLDPAVIADLNDSVTDGSIGLSKLSSEVSNALKPVVVGQPSSVVRHAGMPTFLTVDATGGENTYQWKKDGVEIAGATNPTLSISDLNASQHEGNYSVVVSNAFGSTTSSVAQIDVNGSLTEGLVGWWKFDETDGNIAYDSSGNGNDGNLTNGSTWTNGKIGGAIVLNGTLDGSSKIEVSNYKGILGVSARSVSAWIKAFDDSHSRTITTWGVGNRYHFFVAGGGNQPGALRLAIGGGYVLGTQKVNSNEWLLVTAVSEENSSIAKSTLYIDSEVESFVEQIGKIINTQEGPNLSIGLEFKGLLDDVRIYDRALSAFEVKALYELGENPAQESGAGTTAVINGTVADGSITTNQLSEQILKYLKPEITQQPTARNIFADTNHTFSVSAEGKYLTYQWKKNGVNLADETNATLTITDANATQHEGNYSVVVSNDFGSVESEELEVTIADFSLFSYSGLMLWLDASNLMTADPIWIDKSGNGNHASKHNTPTVQTNAQNGLSLMRYEKVLPASDTDYHEWNDISDIRTLFAVFKRDNGNDGAVLTDDNFYHFYSDGSPMLSSTFASHNVKNGLYRLNGTAITAISTNYPVSLSIVAIRTLGNVEASRIGRDRSVDYGHFDGDFAELIIFNTPLSDDYISEVEGYLAHKWGLTALLPSNHTYKNSVP